VSVQHDDEQSSLRLARRALALRHTEPALGDGEMVWDAVDSPWVQGRSDVLSFVRPGRDGEASVRCVTVFGTDSLELPEGSEVLVCSTSEPGAGPATMWLRA
jgi:alpha-glucosidase